MRWNYKTEVLLAWWWNTSSVEDIIKCIINTRGLISLSLTYTCYCIVISLSPCKIIIIHTTVKETNSMSIIVITQDDYMQNGQSFAPPVGPYYAILSAHPVVFDCFKYDTSNLILLAVTSVWAQCSQLCCNNDCRAWFSFSSCPRTKGVHAIFIAYIFTCSCVDNLRADLVPYL